MLRNIRPGAYVEFTSNDGENLNGEVLFSDDVQKYFVFRKLLIICISWFRTIIEKR